MPINIYSFILVGKFVSLPCMHTGLGEEGSTAPLLDARYARLPTPRQGDLSIIIMNVSHHKLVAQRTQCH